MNRALWLLLRLRYRAAARRFARNLRSIKGIALTLAGLALLLPAVGSMALMPRPGPEALAAIRRAGPFLLLVYAVLGLVTRGSGEVAIAFTPAEVGLLFPGPFRRRDLLLYKMAVGIASILLISPLMAGMLWMITSGFLAGTVGLALAFTFMHLFVLAAGLAAETAGVLAFNTRRKVVLAVVVVLVLAMGLSAGADLPSLPLLERADRLEHTWAARAAALPFRPFAEAITAERIWPDLIVAAAAGLAVDVALAALVLVLGSGSLEASAAASARLSARIEQARRTGGTLRAPRSGRVKSRVPMLPAWGGVGPIAWRQLTTARRDVVRMGLILFILSPALMPLVVAGRLGRDQDTTAFSIEGVVLGMGFVLISMMTFDFRADLDRMPELKALPLAPSRVALGQVLTPILVTTCLQWLILGPVGLRFGGQLPWRYWALACFALPANALMVTVENLGFLWFPIRLAGANGFDLQMMGRSMILLVVKLLIVVLAGGLAAGLGAAAYFLGGGWPAALALSWLLLIAGAASLLPFIGLAFERFDVTRDTPA